MANDDDATTRASPAQLSGEQERAKTQNGTGHQQTERESQQDSGNDSAPPLPPRALPPPHQASVKARPLPPLPGAHFAPLPVHLPPQQPPDFQRPRYPGWEKTKLVLQSVSLVAAAVIFGIGVAFGYNVVRYFPRDYFQVELEVALSFAPAGAAIAITALDFLKRYTSKRQYGLHPGALVAFHLITWLVAVAAVTIVAIYVSDEEYNYSSYDYDSDDQPVDEYARRFEQNMYFQNVLLGFDCVLLFVHFVLFVGACVETNRVERARKQVVVVQVPYGAPGPYPNPQYPVYGSPQSIVPQSRSQPGRYPGPVMAPVPRQAGAGTDPASPQPAALYGGYYAPAPPEMAWTAAQQQSNPGLLQGYYAPGTVPAGTPSNSARQSRRGPSASGAISSGSRRSQAQAATPVEEQHQQQGQSGHEGTVAEKPT
ncbi:uncharacterized protein B0T15DRAFT_178249 [Chaetomium strumarium]|uniref:MARVEL domain-containing protein n=1 Tax=Chaetomium strumarium TaxID=1170767 RepID=A0AAJ0GX33_9PEZI|nr:hypothetical protein B0T15DRAFT_178249 [Chaetomium strumarium]